MKLLPFLLCFSILEAATTTIDCGSPSDSNFTGGVTYTIPNPPAAVTDPTMRYSAGVAPATGVPFAYRIPVDNIPYVVTFRFVEPTVTLIGARIFSIQVNNQTVVDRIDLVAEAGFQKPVSRSIIVMGADQVLAIVFTAQVRSVVVSAIEIQPLFQVYAHSSGLLRIEAGALSITGSETSAEWKAASGWAAR